jgi:tRNA (guanine-N7-)-methyltransferase
VDALSVAPVLRPGLRTFKPRRSRITPRQRRALDDRSYPLTTARELVTTWPTHRPVIIDIGFGSAEPVLDLAARFPHQTIVAIDVHSPGIGDLVDRCRTEGVENVLVIEADALDLLPGLSHKAAGFRSFFPDPWPKARHHKRRLVQPAVVQSVHDHLVPGGYWHIATDWAEYAAAIEEVFDEDDRWHGGVIERPDWRPLTHFERRAIRDGRQVVDLWFERK